jgi:large subunit ribosomal protein L22
MEASAYIKNVAISPKKVLFLLKDLKRMAPAQALHHLRYTNKAPAQFLYKAIQSALANAKNTLNASEDLLQFRVLTVEEGRKLKRFRPGGRGMAKPYVHKFSHIKVVIGTRDGAVSAKPVKKVQPQKAEAEPVKKEQARPKLAAPRDARRTGQQHAVKPRTVTRQKKG